jgi:hypothetical protein
MLILGSASPDWLKQSSETLAGRLETVPLEGFRLADLGRAAQTRHWVRGGSNYWRASGRRKNRGGPTCDETGGGAWCPVAAISARAPFSPRGETWEFNEKACWVSLKMAFSPRDENRQKTERE